LTGKNVVLMFDKGVYFSNRLPINYKEKLLDLLNSYNFKYGVIFRSSSINISFDELILEIQELSNKFDEVINKFNNSSNVECLYDVGNVVDKLINDLYSDGLEVEVNEVEKLEILKLKYPKCSFQFIDKNLKYKSIVLFTQPLSEDNVLTEEEKISLYKTIIGNYDQEKLVIKTHPRETTNYRDYFPNIEVFNENYPSEILDVLGIRFEKAVTIFSTAVYVYSKENIIFYGTKIHPKLLSRFGRIEYE